jgi:hypothetical protein
MASHCEQVLISPRLERRHSRSFIERLFVSWCWSTRSHNTLNTNPCGPRAKGRAQKNVRRSFIPRARARIQQTNQSEFDVVRPSSTQSVRERGVQARADECSMRAVQTSTRWRPNRPSALVQPLCSSHRDGAVRRSTHRGSQRASVPARSPLGGDRDEASHSCCDRAVLQREVRHVQQSLFTHALSYAPLFILLHIFTQSLRFFLSLSLRSSHSSHTKFVFFHS